MSNPVYGKKAVQSRNAEKLSSLTWVLIIGFIVFLVWAPFQVGLFNGQMMDYEKPLYIGSLICCLLLLVWIGGYYKQFSLQDNRDALAVAVLLLPLTYALAVINAASHYLAVNMVFVQTMYAAIFIISLYLLRSKQINVIIQYAVLTVSYVIVGFGLMNWLGSAKLAGSLVGWFSNTVYNGVFLDSVMTDSNGLRLTAIFQYANTYAAFTMAFLFVAVFALIRSKKWYGVLTHAFMLVPIIISMFLTLSRGGLVLMPVVFVLLLLFLRPAQQILWVVYLALAGIISLAVLNPISNIGQELSTNPSTALSAKGWGYLIGASVLMAVLGWVIQRFVAPWLEAKLEPLSRRRLSNLWLPIGATALVALAAYLLIATNVRNILPANVAVRFENINFQQHSVLERFTFYKDALKVVKEYPVLGAGGGGWASLYEKYQNNPYTSRQAHNFFLQYLIEVGIVGFLIFMGFILYIFYKYIRGYVKHRERDQWENGFFYVIIAMSILIHSILDFNMSYAFMGLLVFIGLAGMAAVMDHAPLRRKLNGNGIKVGYSAVLALAAVVVVVFAARSTSSASAAMETKRTVQVSSSYEAIKEPLDRALAYRPTHPEMVLYLSSVDQSVFQQTGNPQFSQEAQDALTRTLKKEPYNKLLLKQQATLYDLLGQSDLAYAIYRDNADKFNWDIDWYEELTTRSLNMGIQDTAKQQEYFKVAEDAYQHVVAGVEHIKTLPAGQMQGRAFEVTPLISMNMAKMKQLSGNQEEAAAFYKQAQESLTAHLGADPANETYWRQQAQLYDLQGQSDQAFAVFRDQAPQFVLSLSWHEELISRAFSMGNQALHSQDQAKKQEYFNAGLAAYQQVVDIASQPQNPQPGQRQIEVTPTIALNAGKMQLMSGREAEAVATLQQALSDNYADLNNREIARYYLAAQLRSGQQMDQAVHDALIQAEPTEQARIDEIVAAKF